MFSKEEDGGVSPLPGEIVLKVVRYNVRLDNDIGLVKFYSKNPGDHTHTRRA